MPIMSEQKAAMESVINAITSVTAPHRGRRNLSSMFMDLVDRNAWPDYYETIPEPRCINNIKASLEKNRYKDPLDVYTDLALVFWNALYYNEDGSQISLDATTLKNTLDSEWRKHTVLPPPRSTSPPPQSAQKVKKPVPPRPQSDPKKPAAPAVSTPIAAPQPKVAQAMKAPAALPVASTSKASLQAVKYQPEQRPSSPDVDVDIGGSPEPEGHSDDPALKLRMEGVQQRDAASEEIVRQLERSLPRWPGFSDFGWMEEGNQSVYSTIIHAVKSHKDVIGNRFASALDEVPDVANGPTATISTPLSLKIIEARVRGNEYPTPRAFDKDMALLFEKARRWHEQSTNSYGHVLLLQRLYQALTSSNPPSGPPYSSTTNFASLKAGPGNVKPVHGDGEGVAGVTNHRVLTRDKIIVDEVHYKGWTIKLADWLHLSNPDDPSRPIIAQVFRCWISEEESKKGQVGVTVSWYYRPEQTYHPANRIFWEKEVFKTSHFAEHPVADIIEKIACQFTARHIRGRPRAPFWWPGFPLYVCDSRYNDRDRIFVRIKNWNSCIPEEVRKSEEFMPIYPFERTVYPSRLASPFLTMGKLLKGPGGLIESSDPADVETADGSGRKTRRALGDPGHSKGLTVPLNTQTTTYPTPSYNQAQPVITQPYQPSPVPSTKPAIDRTVLTAAGGPAMGNNVHIEKLPSDTTRHFDRDPETNQVLWFATPPLNIAPTPKPRHSLAYLHFLATKRKRESQEDGDQSTGESEESAPKKHSRFTAPPTVLEQLAALQKDLST
ncbi:rsc complex protein [Moniliophthora roreri]|nr:rsc complex protein [Moniliophthora roreri]